jgi:hypothetical protein
VIVTRARRRFLTPAILFSLVGCRAEAGNEGSAAHAGPRLTPLDSTLVAEADTLYLGNPYSLAIDAFDGSFYISDFFADRVFRFRRDGTLVRTYGRPGSGPGEFRTPTLAWPLDSLHVAAADNDHQLIHVFGRESGELVRSIRYEGRLGSTPPVTVGSVAWMPSRHRGRGTSVAALDLRSDSIRFSVPLPDEYLQSFRGLGRFAAFHAMGAVTAWKDTVLVGMRGLNHLLLARTGGDVVDTLHVPVARRRGVPPNIVAIVDDRDPDVRPHDASSSLDHLFRRPDGSLVLIHHDAKLEGDLPSGLITARAFVSVVSPDRTRACVDAELPVSRDARPIEGFRGDTLFLLDRRIHGEAMQTWIVSYLVQTRGCDWLPTRR